MKYPFRPGSPPPAEEELLAMRRYACALTRDEPDAEDVVQDALVRALEREDTFQQGRSRRRWLLAIVHNVFVSRKRSEAAEVRRNKRFAETLLGHLDPEQELVAQLSDIAHAFAALPEQQRAVLHLIAVEETSYQEAAEILGVPIGTVMSRLSRARTTLRNRNAETTLRLVGGSNDS